MKKSQIILNSIATLLALYPFTRFYYGIVYGMSFFSISGLGRQIIGFAIALILSIISIKIAPNIWGKVLLIISSVVVIIAILLVIYAGVLGVLGSRWSNN